MAQRRGLKRHRIEGLAAKVEAELRRGLHSRGPMDELRRRLSELRAADEAEPVAVAAVAQAIGQGRG